MSLFNFKELQCCYLRNIGLVFPNKTKCIIIGSNQSILTGHYGDYIDNADAVVVRINRMPTDAYFANYGHRTDMIVGYDPKLGGLYKYPAQYRLALHSFEELAKREFNITRATTGFGAILLLGCVFDEIELFGYGFTKREYEDGYFHYLDGTTFEGYHDLREEDAAINKLQQQFKGKIYRGEEVHEELRCDNTCEK